MRLAHSIAAAALCLAAAASAIAQEAWTEQPIRLVIPASAGGSMDQMARPLAAVMSRLSGQTFIVENRSGGAGVLAREFVAHGPADGTVFLLGSVHELTRMALTPNLSFPLTGPDFVPVAKIATVPNLVVVKAGTGVDNVDALVAKARSSPKGISYGVGSLGNLQHLAGITFAQSIGAHMVAIPYKGSAPALKDLAGGQIDVLFDTMPAASAFVREGRLRALAVTAANRSPLFPDVPTLKELGLERMVLGTWYGAFAPAKTPARTIEAAAALFSKALMDPEIQRMWQEWGSEKPVPQSRTAFADFVQAEAQRWQEAVRQAGLKVE
ncbi:MAG: tripartite tricarboxylate transporter substrate binding protein [Pigmentiphaga sp.]|uniref:tripartite tricarboxylate transporter substrate binding protein n=1 Tax=Pigmentiphaga sp. TaxID=1977564 RepID=UPI0029A1A0C2|nr:tripartite tricarboxylate transporter substrate binding protein [Pigmentiphaga sp.]MDX3906927.1 tripartite tricarboxylate transporter substrate binding protein [Pigmentiphaga sp.]